MGVSRVTACIVLGAALALLAACSGTSESPPSPSPTASESLPSPSYWPTQGWRTDTPEAQGLDSTKLAEALQTIRDENLNIHSLLIIRNDVVVLDAYFYPFDDQTVHQLASVTKSVMTTLIAIAADQGKLDLDQPMVSFFPDRTIANRDDLKEHITVRHLAGMTSGLDCTAENDEQTLMEMNDSPDWVQFALDRKVVYEPGTHFEYCSPGMHLLSAILQQATGTTALEFARLNLFTPLGIEDVFWDVDPQGYNYGWAGLHLHPRDVAKLGYLWLYQGQWEGKQIVSSQWVEESVKRQITTGRGDDYGYGWWVMPGDQGEYAAQGRGGQYIRVFPAMNAMVVTTGGGFLWDDLGPLVASAVVDTANPLPANPEGVDELNAALTTAQEAPAPQPVAPLPETARAISGKTFVFGPNPLDLETLRLDFDDSAEARLEATFTADATLPPVAVGLDGVYRLQPVGDYDLPLGLRGQWLDEQTFLLDYDQIANLDAYVLVMTFEDDRVSLVGKERTHEASIEIEGEPQGP
jgi:CubicO group peptidase (beta-lactamase class C family)